MVRTEGIETMYAEIYLMNYATVEERTTRYGRWENETGMDFRTRIERTVDYIVGDDRSAKCSFNIFNADGTDADMETI